MAGVLAILLAFFAPAARAQDQAALQAEACMHLVEIDAELNEVYEQVLEAHASDPSGIERLREAQRAWIRFRDLHLESIYPPGNDGRGSALSMCACLELAALTQQRIDQLRAWLQTEEGDVCAGSRMLPPEQHD